MNLYRDPFIHTPKLDIVINRPHLEIEMENLEPRDGPPHFLPIIGKTHLVVINDPRSAWDNGELADRVDMMREFSAFCGLVLVVVDNGVKIATHFGWMAWALL
ncbi:hypothetical protein PG984_011229 [Apiospora sp. TS-2023a]